MKSTVPPVIANNTSCSQSFDECRLDGEWQVTLLNIKSEGKLKSPTERTKRQDMSGRWKWILDTHTQTQFVTKTICQTFQSSPFPSSISSRSSVDNNSHPSLMTIRGELLWLCAKTRRGEAITHRLSRRRNVGESERGRLLTVGKKY